MQLGKEWKQQEEKEGKAAMENRWIAASHSRVKPWMSIAGFPQVTHLQPRGAIKRRAVDQSARGQNRHLALFSTWNLSMSFEVVLSIII